MKRIAIHAVGRLKDKSLNELCTDFYRRCRRTADVAISEHRDLPGLVAALPKRGTLIVLDERGEHYTSPQFAQRLGKWLESASEIAFVIGGADGVGDGLRERADSLLALSKMTLAHRLARLIFAEQLYRAVSILEGSPYHR